MQTFSFETIGVVHSPYTEKFGIPRQPGLVDAPATLELLPPYNRAEAVKGLEGFSHLWLTFVFHAVKREQWRPTVRPPRLGGNERVGVFASRSTHRPNPIGLSVVRLERIEVAAGKVVLQLNGCDLLDGTPVLDIKPYIPYVDSIPDADAGFAPAPPTETLKVCFTTEAEQALQHHLPEYPALQALIEGVLAQDPRPAYRSGEESEREYGVLLYGLNVRFVVRDGCAEVIALEPRGGAAR